MCLLAFTARGSPDNAIMPGPSRKAIATALICCVLAALFTWISYSAVLTKAATIDEPLHTAAAYTHTFLGDWRVDAENPPLWKYWAMLGTPRDTLRVDRDDPAWRDVRRRPDPWSIEMLYRTAGVDGAAVVNRARQMMVLLGAALCLLTS